jgi:hypothetical protein
LVRRSSLTVGCDWLWKQASNHDFAGTSSSSSRSASTRTAWTAPACTSAPRRLHEQLRAAILDGRIKAGAALPSTRQARRGLGIARNTVIAAYDLLIAEGYVVPRPGRQGRGRRHRHARIARDASSPLPH